MRSPILNGVRSWGMFWPLANVDHQDAVALYRCPPSSGAEQAYLLGVFQAAISRWQSSMHFVSGSAWAALQICPLCLISHRALPSLSVVFR
jgi:hypothetical protein